METKHYLIIAIAVIAVLVVTFIVSFVLYKKTPAPKGCENLQIDEEKCQSCPVTTCHNYPKEKEDE